jgi:hypothetical protein
VQLDVTTHLFTWFAAQAFITAIVPSTAGFTSSSSERDIENGEAV